MPVVDVGEVGVLVGQWFVGMEVPVPHAFIDRHVMSVLVMLVVDVPVVVNEAFVGVLVRVVLAQVQPHTR